jgi:hypothetical protein
MPSKRPYIQWFSSWQGCCLSKKTTTHFAKVANKVGQQLVVQEFYFIHLCSESNVYEKICLQSSWPIASEKAKKSFR